MCSHFLKRMENYQGDLTDIIRAPATKTQAASAAAAPPPAEWQFPISNNPGLIYTTDPGDDFGDPFTHLRDPLIIHGIENPVSGFLHHSDRDIIVEETAGINGGALIPPPSANVSLGHKVLISHEEQMIKRPNMFSRMLQIAPNAKPTLSPCDSPAAPHQSLISPNSSKVNCLVESSGLQISSPRNTGIRRRKSQAKKVVCIPAPAPANSRSSGEVVPSDLWAWRKYGQKPIKGSPYPRGYYRCSSSKGCSARKQVERSRTDPNMLVITYTSEHNHPWPTQRNALAGSTRSQPSKNNNNTSSKASQNLNKLEEEHHTKLENTVKQEIEITTHEQDNNFDSSSCHHIEMEDDAAAALSVEFDQGFDSYKPTLPQSEDNFFADLGEIDCDPLDILLTQGFSGEDGRESKDILDPFTFYDWANNNNNHNTAAAAAATSTTRAAAATSYGEPKNNDSSSSS